jgi:lipopolysaccharide transport system permease protein
MSTAETIVTDYPGEWTRVIRPKHGLVALDFAELWRYRELLVFFVWRNILIRYKQTVIGVAWALVQPVLTMVVFTVFFGRLARMPSEGYPYEVYTFCALLPWQLFAFALSESSSSVVRLQGVVTKVYFPRLIIPISAVCVGVVDFVLAFGVLLGLMAWYGVWPGLGILTVPFWVLFAVATALAAGLWLSALNVRYRDIRYTVPFIAQLWMLASPVVYPTSLVPEAWRALYALNPMVGVVDGFRWALLGQAILPIDTIAVSGLVVAVMLTGGLFYFRRMERSFADII